MATIFQKSNPTGFANCAILAPQENYYAPFLSQIGPWNQIRVSAHLSYCGTGASGGFTNGSLSESVVTNTANLGWYYGVGSFSTPVGVVTPISVGCNFIGASTYTQGGTTLALAQANGGGACISNAIGANPVVSLVANGTTYTTTQFSLFAWPVFPPSGNTGSFNYCVPNTIVIQIFNAGLTGQQIGISPSFDETGSNPNYSSFTDIGPLRIGAMNLPSSGTMKVSFYTTGLVATGGPLPIPDTVFFRSPLNNNFLRIHSLLVEKYA